MIEESRGRSPVQVTADNYLLEQAGAKLFWLVVSAGATGGSLVIKDGSSGSTVLSLQAPASSSQFYGPFDPPIPFATGPYVDLTGSNITVSAMVN